MPSGDNSEVESPSPQKRARLSSSGPSNGNMTSSLPPLSPSILGVEPLDEFILDVADFVHHMIHTRPEGGGIVEVEAKIGILKSRMNDQRLALPIRVETSTTYVFALAIALIGLFLIVLAPNEIDVRFESNMTVVSASFMSSQNYPPSSFH
jgi:polynucleotide 5'-triphosphatase